MKELSKAEREIIRSFVEVSIPDFIKGFNDEKIDLMDCYEVGFVFAHDLLKGQKIDPNFSPWGDGNSVIFEPYYSEVLQNIQKDNLDETINHYCQLFLNVLEVFKKHFIQ